MRAVARLHQVSLFTVQWWVRRAGDLSLEEVDWSNRSPLPARSGRTAPAIEDLVLMLRRELRERSALGEYGAKAIYSELVARRHAAVPSLRTIGRILERRGALDGGRRIRRNPPPAGWYLPEVAAGRAELDSFDIVEGLALEGGLRVEVLNAVSLRGGLPGAWPQRLVTAKTHGAGAFAALASVWAARLRAVRQRHHLPRQPQRSRLAGPRDTDLLATGRNSGVRTSSGARIPGRHRKLQRSLASQGVESLPP